MHALASCRFLKVAILVIGCHPSGWLSSNLAVQRAAERGTYSGASCWTYSCLLHCCFILRKDGCISPQSYQKASHFFVIHATSHNKRTVHVREVLRQEDSAFARRAPRAFGTSGNDLCGKGLHFSAVIFCVQLRPVPVSSCTTGAP